VEEVPSLKFEDDDVRRLWFWDLETGGWELPSSSAS
jgi:hypothetical protein